MLSYLHPACFDRLLPARNPENVLRGQEAASMDCHQSHSIEYHATTKSCLESIRDSALICYLPSPAALISQSMQDPVVSQKYVLYMNNRTKLIPKIQYTTTHSPNNQHLSRQSVKTVKKGIGFYSCHFSYYQS